MWAHEQLVGDAPERRHERQDDDHQAAVEARLPPAGDGARRARQVAGADGVEEPVGRRRAELQRRDLRAADVREDERSGGPHGLDTRPPVAHAAQHE